MAYSEKLAARIRARLGRARGYSERKMFGGLCVMLGGRMCAGVLGENLIVRVAPADYDAVRARPHAARFDFTGRPMKGIVMVHPAGCASAPRLDRWLALGVAVARAAPAKNKKRKTPAGTTRPRGARRPAARRPRRPSRAR